MPLCVGCVCVCVYTCPYTCSGRRALTPLARKMSDFERFSPRVNCTMRLSFQSHFPTSPHFSFYKMQINHHRLCTDKDSLLKQTLVRLLNLLIGPSAHFLIKSSFIKISAKSESPPLVSDHPQYLMKFLIFYHPPHR